MKILVQNTSTGKFLRSSGCWTSSAGEALAFKSSAAAVEFYVENDLDDVQIILRFDDTRYDAKLPLRNSGKSHRLRPKSGACKTNSFPTTAPVIHANPREADFA